MRRIYATATMLLVLASTAFCVETISFSYQLEKGSRTILYEVSDYSIMDKGKPYQVRVKSDTDEKATAKQMVQSAQAGSQVLPWRNSDRVQVTVDVGDDSASLEYKTLGSKREDTANTHIYVLHPIGSRVLCRDQEAIRVRGSKESRLALVPPTESGIYKTADSIDAFLQGNDSQVDAPTSYTDAGKLILKSLKPEEGKNAYERLVERIPGTWGFGIMLTMRGSEYVFENVEGERRETLLKVTDGNYSLTKLDFYQPKNTKDILNARVIGRHIDLGFEQTFGKPVYLVVASVGFTEDVSGNTRYSYLKNLNCQFRLTDDQGIDGDLDGLLALLQGHWEWAPGSGSELLEELSFDVEGKAMVVHYRERPRSGVRVIHGAPVEVVVSFLLVPPVAKEDDKYVIKCQQSDGKNMVLVVSKAGRSENQIRISMRNEEGTDGESLGVFVNPDRMHIVPVEARPFDTLNGTARRLVTTLNGRPATGKSLSLNLGSGVKMEFVWIKILNSWVGKYEVTNEEYRRFKKDHDSTEYEGHTLNGDSQPAVYVSYEDAVKYADWINKQYADQLPNGYKARLPKDWEWSVAVGLNERKDGTPKEKDQMLAGYPWGNQCQWPPPRGAGNYTKIDGYNDGYAVTAPVGSFDKNKYGLYDMGGNVWEWCEDWYSNDKKCRVLRGGSWYGYGLFVLSCSYRCRHYPSRSYKHFGFRLLLSSRGHE